MRKPSIAAAIFMCALGAGVLGIRTGSIPVPPESMPWTPLDVTAPPNFWTRHKLARLSDDRALCRAVLDQTTLDYEPVPDGSTGRGCGFSNAVLVKGTPSDVGEEFPITCRTAVSLSLWERHVVQPAARRHFGQAVTGIEHFGSYSCRNVNGRPAATRSRHATAEAWDVAGFVLADGTRIRVVRDWRGKSGTAAFLRDVRDGACQFFDGVLSPDYDAAHRDHLHLDRGPYRLCR
jgi:hypothetical protein